MPNKEGKQSTGFKRMAVLLAAVLIALIIIIILLLLRSCDSDDGPAGVLDPDYAIKTEEPNAEPVESDPEETKPEVAEGGGSVSMSFMDKVTYNLSTGQISLYYQNPHASTHNVVVQVILTHGEDEYLLAESGVLKAGYQVTSLEVDKNAPQLSAGGYNGKLRLLFYDPETGERAIVDTDIPCTITVKE